MLETMLLETMLLETMTLNNCVSLKGNIVKKQFITLLALIIAGNAYPQTLPDFNPATGTLTIPEIKVASDSVYNVKLKFDGSQSFTVQSFETSPPSAFHPIGKIADMEQWVASGTYKSWACEPTPHSQTLTSPHGRVRICSNPLLAASTGNVHPVGAISFKELYAGSSLIGHAVGVKVKAGTTADTWYWYETINGTNVANGTGLGVCENCHNAANATDRVFVRVR